MFEISTDLQRVNHYIADVAKHAVRLGERPPRPAWRAVKEAADLTELSLRRAVESYRHRDPEQAALVLADEDRWDVLYSHGIKALQATLRADPEGVAVATELLFVLTSLQRVGEHAVSIAWHTDDMLGSRRTEV